MRHFSPVEFTAPGTDTAREHAPHADPRHASGGQPSAAGRAAAVPGLSASAIVSLALCAILMLAAVLSAAVMIVHANLLAGVVALLSVGVIVTFIMRQMQHGTAEIQRVADAQLLKLDAALD